MTTTPDDLNSTPPATSSWSARWPTPGRAAPSRRRVVGCRRWRSTGRPWWSGPTARGPFLDLFQGRHELVVHQHMWYDGEPYQGQCEGCTTTAWHLKGAVH